MSLLLLLRLEPGRQGKEVVLLQLESVDPPGVVLTERDEVLCFSLASSEPAAQHGVLVLGVSIVVLDNVTPGTVDHHLHRLQGDVVHQPQLCLTVILAVSRSLAVSWITDHSGWLGIRCSEDGQSGSSWNSQLTGLQTAGFHIQDINFSLLLAVSRSLAVPGITDHSGRLSICCSEDSQSGSSWNSQLTGLQTTGSHSQFFSFSLILSSLTFILAVNRSLAISWTSIDSSWPSICCSKDGQFGQFELIAGFHRQVFSWRDLGGFF